MDLPKIKPPEEMLLTRAKQVFLSADKEGLFWLVSLDNITPEDVDSASVFLNDDDLRKSSGYVFQKDRHRSTVVYGILKYLLGELIHEPPQSIRFIRNAFGKPALFNNPIHFNLSHTSDFAFIGVHPSTALGVDIEKVDSSIAIMDALDSFLHPEEKHWLYNTFRDPFLGAYMLWSAKESLLKAVGTGFSSSSLPDLQEIASPFSNVHHFKGRLSVSEEGAHRNEMEAHVYSNILAHHILSVSMI